MAVRAQPSRKSPPAGDAGSDASIAAELHRHREWFRVTLASIADAVITTDVHGRVTFMNPAAEALTKWASADAIGQDLQTIFNIIDGQTRKPPQKPVDRVLTDDVTMPVTKDTILIDRKGSEICIEDSAAPIKVGGGITGVIVVFRDVTERRKIERGLQRSERLLADFLRTPPLDCIGLVRMAPFYGLIELNSRCSGIAMKNLLGTTSENFTWTDP